VVADLSLRIPLLSLAPPHLMMSDGLVSDDYISDLSLSLSQLLTSKGVKFFSTSARPGAAAPAAASLLSRRSLFAAPALRRRLSVPATMKVDARA
jgi:hypothetical protein